MADPMVPDDGTVGDPVRWATPAGRWVLLATVLGTSLAFLDLTSSNVALPAIGEDLGVGLSTLQWTINAYTLTLASLILVGGALGDHLGRRRVYLVGVAWFAGASLLCGLAPNGPVLVMARALQGVGGALLTPGSLALLQSVFAPGDRARAIGAWSGLTGVAAAAGPLVGGWLVQVGSWRLIFLTNLPIAVLVWLVARRHVPETRDVLAARGIDARGALLTVLALGTITWALIDAGARGVGPTALAVGALGLVACGALVIDQRRSRRPMLPPRLFASRQFTGANLATALVYAALGGMFFFLFLQLQQVLGYSPVQAGLAALPITGLLVLLSSRAGALATRIGPRLPMTVGPLLMSAGLLLHLRIGPGSGYLDDVLPAVTVFGLGLAGTVAPLTATVLAAVDQRHVGVASGVNNAVARAAGLLAVAILPLAAGLDDGSYLDPGVFTTGFQRAMLLAAALAAAGGVVAWSTIRTDEPPLVAPLTR